MTLPQSEDGVSCIMHTMLIKGARHVRTRGSNVSTLISRNTLVLMWS